MTFEHHQPANGRADAFSDGVFAIAITILAFELRVPDLEPGASAAALTTALLQRWPVYVAFLFSFATILIMWVSHHNLCRLIARTDNSWLFLNGLLLMLITAVPFPTALVGTYLLGPAGLTACVVYCGLLFLVATAFNLLWAYVANAGLLRQDAVIPQISSITRSYYVGPLLYLLALGIAFVNTFASLALCGAMAVFYASLSYQRKYTPDGAK